MQYSKSDPDLSDFRSAVHYPNAREIVYERHPGGRVWTISDGDSADNAGDNSDRPIATYEYIGGRTLVRSMQNGVNLDLRDGAGSTYDKSGRPLRFLHRNGDDGNEPLLGFDSVYDRGGNKLLQRSIHDPRDTQRYAYDSAGRLTAFVRGDFTRGEDIFCDAPTTEPLTGMTQARRYYLDGNGNWSSVVTKQNDVITTETRLDTSFNEYYDIGGTSQTHDANGNLTNDGTRKLIWDAFDRLVEVCTTSDTRLATFTYDAGNRRVRKDIENDGEGKYDIDYYYLDWQVIEEHSDIEVTYGGDEPLEFEDIVTRQYVYGNYIDEPLIMDANNLLPDVDEEEIEDYLYELTDETDTRYYYHHNTIYSVIALTDIDGDIIEGYEYDPYGKHVVISDGDSDGVVEWDDSDTRSTLGASLVGNCYFFTARRWDKDTELQYSRQRHFDPIRGRWASRDPSEGQLTEGRYQCVLSNPLSGVDPHGTYTVDGALIGEYTAKYPYGDYPGSTSPKTSALSSVRKPHGLTPPMLPFPSCVSRWRRN